MRARPAACPRARAPLGRASAPGLTDWQSSTRPDEISGLGVHRAPGVGVCQRQSSGAARAGESGASSLAGLAPRCACAPAWPSASHTVLREERPSLHLVPSGKGSRSEQALAEETCWNCKLQDRRDSVCTLRLLGAEAGWGGAAEGECGQSSSQSHRGSTC